MAVGLVFVFELFEVIMIQREKATSDPEMRAEQQSNKIILNNPRNTSQEKKVVNKKSALKASNGLPFSVSKETAID
jgi:hypothetical protein